MQYDPGYSNNPILNLVRGGIVKKIVIANVGVFILQLLLVRTDFIYYFALSPRLVLTRGYVWQLVTYMFLHGGFFHIALNMLIIWMFGTPLERLWGSDRFLRFYLYCGLGGALFSFLFAFRSAVIGASGAGYGILLAYAVLFPYNEIYVWGIFPVKARTLVIVLAVIELLAGISGGSGIAHFAHLGGMAAGLVYTKRDHRSWRFWSHLKNLLRKFPIRFSADGDGNDADDEPYDAGKIDSILDKIAQKGYENLTETERRILENYSRKTPKH